MDVMKIEKMKTALSRARYIGWLRRSPMAGYKRHWESVFTRRLTIVGTTVKGTPWTLASFILGRLEVGMRYCRCLSVLWLRLSQLFISVSLQSPSGIKASEPYLYFQFWVHVSSVTSIPIEPITMAQSVLLTCSGVFWFDRHSSLLSTLRYFFFESHAHPSFFYSGEKFSLSWPMTGHADTTHTKRRCPHISHKFISRRPSTDKSTRQLLATPPFVPNIFVSWSSHGAVGFLK